MSKSLELEVHSKNAKLYYMRDGNIRWSFNTLEKEAERLGARLENGDILVVDNPLRNRRKVFKKTRVGAIQLYATLFEQKFSSLRNKGNGLVDIKAKPIASYLEY